MPYVDLARTDGNVTSAHGRTQNAFRVSVNVMAV